MEGTIVCCLSHAKRIITTDTSSVEGKKYERSTIETF